MLKPAAVVTSLDAGGLQPPGARSKGASPLSGLVPSPSQNRVAAPS